MLNNIWGAVNKGLLHACQHGYENIYHLLMDCGANPNHDPFSKLSPLMAACEGGNISIVQSLISNGANVNFKDNEGNLPHYFTTMPYRGASVPKQTSRAHWNSLLMCLVVDCRFLPFLFV